MSTADPPVTGPMPVEIPFVGRLGLTLEHCADGEARVALPLQAWHMNSFEVAHGGVLMTMLDVALALAARSRFNGRADALHEIGVVTIEMKTSFMQPGRGRLVAHGRCLHASVQIAFCEGELRDADGGLVARASGTFKAVRQRALARPG